ncbi:MAG: hypothetical protein JW841_16425 [Deltaproteobacteria bacterium]|nr:hypothetical protein [Deltaproteobacteria bacterium]
MMRAIYKSLLFVSVPTVLTVLGCGGPTVSSTKVVSNTAKAPAANAPAWALEGDQKTNTGSYFICEGQGPNEDQALRAAQGICSAKICELCGVEVKSTVETRETLEQVNVERKVVETCRRVRKSEDEIRYKQSSCGPDGCTSWLQVFYSAAAEARECKAYADGNFADPAECERIIEEFRKTPGLSFASFNTRVDLLNQAIVACAEIDVRPTPRLTALDEILWQGVLSPSLIPWRKNSDDKSKPLKERVLDYLELRRVEAQRGRAQEIYRPIDRQQLRETKVFVERIAKIRDAMRAYASIIYMFEELANVQFTLAEKADTKKLVDAMAAVIPIGKYDRMDLHMWVTRVLSATYIDWPEVKKFLMQTYPPPTGYTSNIMLLFKSDELITDDEWEFVSKGESCITCYAKLLSVVNHDGAESKRFNRVVTVVKKLYTEKIIPRKIKGVTDVLDAEYLLRLEPEIPKAIVNDIYTWDRLMRAYKHLAIKGMDKAADKTRKKLVERLRQQLKQDIASEKCNHLDHKLKILEEEGINTSEFEKDLCKCIQKQKSDRRVGDLDELFLRLINWGATCVNKGGASS